ncbi:MAG: hypothetical protein CK430_06440 [Legionella sp.]|nr:MAG: hypothetical protein CK430_06440 [Legionella sp.]
MLDTFLIFWLNYYNIFPKLCFMRNMLKFEDEKALFEAEINKYVATKSISRFFQPETKARTIEISQKGAKFLENICKLKSIPATISRRDEDFYAQVLYHATNFIKDPSLGNYRNFHLCVARLLLDRQFLQTKILDEAFTPSMIVTGIMAASISSIIIGICALTAGLAVTINPVGILVLGIALAVAGITLIVTHLLPCYRLYRDSNLDDLVAFYDCLKQSEDFNSALSTDTSLLVYRQDENDDRGILSLRDDEFLTSSLTC